MKIEPMAGCPLGTPGNRRQNSGEISRPKNCITPARSPIFIRPSHRASTPVSPKDISKALAADVNDAPITSPHTSGCPMHVLITHIMKASTKNAIHI